MRSLQVILITLATLVSCTKKMVSPAIVAAQKDTTKAIPMPDTSLSYLALGDSYTVGQSVIQNESFPYQLVNLLNSVDKFDVKYPTMIATTGWTTYDLISAIDHSNVPTNHFDFVTLLIGVNDQYHQVSDTIYRVQFAQVLQMAINAAKNSDSTRVFVLSIPDYGVTPFALGQDSVIGPEIDQFNAINKAISLKAGVNYLDITGISREAATDTSLIASDGLHPSPKMYALWIQQLAPMVEARLKKN